MYPQHSSMLREQHHLHRIQPLDLEIQVIMQRTSRIKRGFTPRTLIPRVQILMNGQFPSTLPAEHGFHPSFPLWPDFGYMTGEFFMAADTSIIRSTALVFNRDYIPLRVPVGTLCERCDVDAVNCRRCRISDFALVGFCHKGQRYVI